MTTPPNPLPCGCRDGGNAIVISCGCQLVGTVELTEAKSLDGYRISWENVHVHHCPLHAAAGELLAALKDNVDAEPCRYDHNDLCQDHYSFRPCRNEVGRAAIAKAEGR